MSGTPAARPRIAVTYCTQCQWLLRAKVLKQKVRDVVWPERDLGHSDRKN